jgi:glucose/mannose-6-phosphate isomerase
LPRKTILNDLDGIRKIDRSNMLSFCVDAPKHYERAAKLARSFSASYSSPKTIIVAGMGGSAIGGELLKDWARDTVPVPIEVCREYSLPAYADKTTLVFVVSYSGETEESLSTFLDAVKRKCMTVCISSGGKLQEFAERLSVPHLLVPSGMAPRATLPYLFMPLPIILERTGLVSHVKPEVTEAIKVLTQVSRENSLEKSLNANPSKKLASNVLGTVPAVYGFGFYRAVAQRFKTQFNENSKVPAKWEFFPELDHNEIVGWEKPEVLGKCFSIIFIRDKTEAKEIRLRIEATKDLMLGQDLKMHEVWSKGRNKMAKMMSVICFGDFTSVYLAVLRGIDPTPVKTISLLKEKLKESGVKEKVVRELQKLTR